MPKTIMTRDEAFTNASNIHQEFGAGRTPTPLAKIARKLNILVDYTPLDRELSGMAMIKDGQKLIWVNSLHHPNRQRFTLAHEIGHHVLHEDILLQGVHVDKGVLRRDTVSSTGTEKIEIVANAFASELLVPTKTLKDLIDKEFDLDDNSSIEKLAKKFRISTAAVQFRLMRL